MRSVLVQVVMALMVAGCGGGKKGDDTSSDPGDTDLRLQTGDTSEGASSGDTAPPEVDRYESPIQIVFKVHIEPQGPVESYRLRRDAVEAVRVVAASHGAKLTIHGNGDFWQYAAAEGDGSLISGWQSAGNDLGPHMHAIYEDPDGSGNWHDATEAQKADSTFVQAMWDDHTHYLQALLPSLTIDQATPFNSLDAGFIDQMDANGFHIVGGGRHEIASAWFGHDPFYPWQIGGEHLEEDLDSPVLMVHHSPQFGEADDHGPPGGRVFQDQTPPHLKLMFLQLYLNRLYAQRQGDADDRVWLYGFLTHDSKSPLATRNEIDDWLSWLDTNFVDVSDSDGQPIASYASFTDVADSYDAWHSAHPGVSSFNVDTPTPINPADATKISDADSKASYPGAFWGLGKQLASNATGTMGFVDFIDDFASDGVKGAELSFGPRANPAVSDPRWLLWTEAGDPVSVDVSGVVGASTVRQWDVVDGGWSEVDAATIEVGDKPVLIDLTSSPVPG